MIQTIDRDLAREQFEALGAEIAATLAQAVEADMAEWGDRLVAAASAGDDEAMRRARHSLKGLCGNFGATELEQLANGRLDSEAERARFLACRTATVAALLAVAAAVE